MSVAFEFSGGYLTLVVCGQAINVEEGNPVCKRLLKLLSQGASEEDMLEAYQDMEEASRPAVSVEAYVEDVKEATYRDGSIYINGEMVHQAVANKVAEFAEMGLPFEHLLRFVERVETNPSYASRQELYDFLMNKHLPITDDGCFLAYKAVTSDYLDKYTRKIDNSPGRVVSMDRGKVDDNRQRHCSKGLHAGALEYIEWYGGAGDQIVIVKIDPKDVVSVPTDHKCQKIRTCRYEVLRDFEGLMTTPLYAQDGSDSYGYGDNDPDDYDWDWFDGPYEDDYYEDGDVSSCPCGY
jgi:hypothetical protein